MDKEDFKKLCPNLYNAIQANQQQYEIYGIKFRSHSIVTFYDIKDRVENPRSTIYFVSKTVLGAFPVVLN